MSGDPLEEIAMKRSLYIGRFQPFHKGHMAIIQSLLKDGRRPIVAIRDTALGHDNPYPAFARFAAVKHRFGDQVDAVAIPDIDEVVFGRSPGYDIRQIRLDPDTEAISGTELRKIAPTPIWLTGNSGAGKTTTAKEIQKEIGGIILDGDDMRWSISENAGFEMKDRYEHNMRVARLARVLRDQGQQVIVSVIAPHPEIRKRIDKVLSPEWFWLHSEQRVYPDRPYVDPSAMEGDPACVFVDTDRFSPREAALLVIRQFQVSR